MKMFQNPKTAKKAKKSGQNATNKTTGGRTKLVIKGGR